LKDEDIGAIKPQSLQRTMVQSGMGRYFSEAMILELVQEFADGMHGENPTISKEKMREVFDVNKWLLEGSQ
jgi:hypothetical protein